MPLSAFGALPGLSTASARLRWPVCPVPAGTAVEPHTHDTDNWGVITKGELRITVDGCEMRYGPGDWYRVPAQALHSARFAVETEEIEFWFRP